MSDRAIVTCCVIAAVALVAAFDAASSVGKAREATAQEAERTKQIAEQEKAKIVEAMYRAGRPQEDIDRFLGVKTKFDKRAALAEVLSGRLSPPPNIPEIVEACDK